MAGAKAHQRFLALGFALAWWYLPKQWALQTTVWLLRFQFYLLKWFCWHNKNFILLFVGIC
jgi:hypothetical protein